MTIYQVESKQELTHTLEELGRRGYHWPNGESLTPSHTHIPMEDIEETRCQAYIHALSESKEVSFWATEDAWENDEDFAFGKEE